MAQMNYDGSDEKRLTPEQRAQLYQSLEEKYAQAGDRSGVDAAEKKSKFQRMGAGLMDGFAMYATAENGVKPVTFDNMRQDADNRVKGAEKLRSEKMAGVLKTDELERMGQDRAFQDKTRSRTEQDWQASDDVKARENDPTSQESQMARDLAKRMMPSKDFGEMTAAELKRGLPTLEKIYSVEQQKLGRQDAARERAAARADAVADRTETRQLIQDQRTADKVEDRTYKEGVKQKESEEKKKASLNEVEDRRINITQNIDILEKMIAKDGTWEATGSHNQDMERLVDQIATDMAKLSDPSSVARPSEVDMVKATLVQPGFRNKNSTALEVLKNFRGEVDRRADTAYKVRGIEKPGLAPVKPAGGMHGSQLPD